jgi:hypothetical protein
MYVRVAFRLDMNMTSQGDAILNDSLYVINWAPADSYWQHLYIKRDIGCQRDGWWAR